MKFNNGKFRIMQITDLQENRFVSPDTIQFLEKALDSEKPDLVVFTGDQLKAYGVSFLLGNKSRNCENTIRKLLTPLSDRNIPFAFTYGNHDAPQDEEKKKQTKVYESFANCVHNEALFKLNQTDLLSLPIYSENGDSIEFYVMLIDSFGKAGGKYTGETEEQVSATKEAIENINAIAGRKVPALLFRHIPVYEMYETIAEVTKDTPNALEGNYTHRNRYYTVTPEQAARGEYMHESIACPETEKGVVDGWLDSGCVLGAYFGHDHINCFIGNYKGIDFGYTPGSGFNVYGPGFDRGVRVFDLTQGSNGYRTHVVTYRDVCGTKLKRPVTNFFYNHAPCSVDAAKPLIIKASATVTALSVLGVVGRILVKKRK